MIFPAADVVEESYLALVAQESEEPPPTGLSTATTTSSSPPPPPPPPFDPDSFVASVPRQHQGPSTVNQNLPPAPPTYHDTRPEQQLAKARLQQQETPPIPRLTQLQPASAASERPDTFYFPTTDTALPDLVPAGPSFSFGSTGITREPDVSRQYFGKVETIVKMASSGHLDPGGGTGSGSGGSGVAVRDLIHPSLTEPLKGQQLVTFRLVKTVSDFTHALSKIHEQHSEDLQSLVEDFRKKNAELRSDRPNCNNSLFNTWEVLLQETETDAQMHSDISGVMSRAVSRPLLEKTFHMKIQSRKVFIHRESYEGILEKTEQMLLKCHEEYCGAYDVHAQQNTAASATTLTEAHNNYVQQLHAANGMIDQFYQETLPQLLQELDDVYHDVSAVVAETLVQGADIHALKAGESCRRYEALGRTCKTINPTFDLNAFTKTLHIPSTLTVSKHIFSTPQAQDPAQDSNTPPLRDELIVDRATQNSARNRFDTLKKAGQDLDVQTRQLSDALETLIRIQARSLESQLFNKANELQEDISLKRFDQRVARLHLGAIRAQKELFASKVEGAGGMFGGGAENCERKLSSSSSESMKHKWVKAFKNIKGSKEQPTEKSTKNGKDSDSAQPAVIENSHVFQEYTYKKITPCDICSQILRGHARQGVKCKVCRMNVHPECQDEVPRCQPKLKLLRRQKSASELESRGMEGDDDSGFSAEPEYLSPGGPQMLLPADHRRERYTAVKSMSMESGKSSGSSRGSTDVTNAQIPLHLGRPIGGSYSAKTGCSSKLIGEAFKINESSAMPKLAQVARALMAAKNAGELPSALSKPYDEFGNPNPATVGAGQNGQPPVVGAQQRS